MLRRIGYGIVVWVVPFVTAMPLLGLMQRDPPLFHNLMIVEGTVVGAVLACAYFRTVTTSFTYEGAVLGLVWMAVNWALDLVTIVPFSGLTPARYFTTIGLTYVCMPALTIAIGVALARKEQRATVAGRLSTAA